MLDRLSPARRNWALGLLGVLVLWFAWSVRSALNPLIVGLLVAFILHPLVLKLERRGWSRKLAVNFIFGSVALAAVLMGIALVVQARALWTDVVIERRSFEHVRDKLDELVRAGTKRIESLGIDLTPDEASAPPDGSTPPDASAAPPDASTAQAGETGSTRALLDEVYERGREWISNEENRAGLTQAGVRAFGGVWAVVGSAFGSLVALLTFFFLVPLYTWFLLFELERMTSFVTEYIPRDQRERWSRIGSEMAAMLGSFFRGRLLVCLLKGGLLSVTLALCGVPYALLVGMLGGFLALIPFIGPGLGYLLAFLLALLEFDASDAIWRTALVFAVGEVGEGYVLMPKILGNELGLHPVVVFASLMIFGSAFGMFGLLLALPLTAAIVILARELVLPALKLFAEGRAARAKT